MKRKLVQINTVCNGSTGKIMCDIAKKAEENNFETYCFFGRGKANKNVNCMKMGNKLSIYFHALLARLGFNGRGSYFSTKKFVKKLKQIEPDIIHLHNVHGYYLNLKIFFNYLKNEYKGKIIWTLHDCWSFTGHCSYFTLVKCNKWKKRCYNCPQLNAYPKEIFDTTKKEFILKESLFSGLNNLTIVTPSVWLKDLVKLSFLKNYDVKVINNGIDLNIFKQIKDKNIYLKYNIPLNKKIILGVANIWEARKGLNDFIELSSFIDDNYQIVLVGVNEKLKSRIPKNIITIKRTDNAEDLAKIYSIAHVLFNPTYEDNYPTVNLECIATKTPVVTYDTGGSKETINNYGIIIENKDYKSLIEFCNNLDKFQKKVNLERIDKDNKFKEYIDLY